MANVLVIDVGTHKAEEVLLFEGRPSLTLRHRARLWKHRAKGFSAAGARRQSEAFKRAFKCRYVLIEPFDHKELRDFLAAVPDALYIKGVASCGPSGPETLRLSGASLGHSIIASKPGLSDKSLPTYNIHFPALYEFLVAAYVTSGDCDRIILRMNAEGVEGPIIDYLAEKAPIKPNVLAGSLGDIKKCFGREAYDAANAKLEQAGIPFVYFTSNSTTWESGLRAIAAAL